jgi:uncharacterized protein YndB with AHSA1/START domain
MKQAITAETSIEIEASSSEVWKALTTPATIKKYLMGTNVSTNWKEGSTITYEGEYNGKNYKDKGIIKKIIPGKIFQSTYWSSMGGKADRPENYNIVTYELEENSDGTTIVRITQDNILSDREQEHAVSNWKMVLQKLKEVVESGD